MGEKEECKKTKVMEADYDASVDEMCDALLESIQEGYHSELEPWEAYEKRMRAEIHESMNDYRDRFAAGYKVLIDELANQPE